MHIVECIWRLPPGGRAEAALREAGGLVAAMIYVIDNMLNIIC